MFRLGSSTMLKPFPDHTVIPSVSLEDVKPSRTPNGEPFASSTASSTGFAGLRPVSRGRSASRIPFGSSVLLIVTPLASGGVLERGPGEGSVVERNVHQRLGHFAQIVHENDGGRQLRRIAARGKEDVCDEAAVESVEALGHLDERGVVIVRNLRIGAHRVRAAVAHLERNSGRDALDRCLLVRVVLLVEVTEVDLPEPEVVRILDAFAEERRVGSLDLAVDT